MIPLNRAQQEAVHYLDGPCLVLAGAGSGKTRVITHKIAHLVQSCGYSPRQIFAVTFTNKAAAEMAHRLESLLGRSQTKGLTISTFHSLGVRFLREHAQSLGLKRGFSILDAQDALGLIQEIVQTTDRARLKHLQQVISLWKNAALDPDQAALEAQQTGEVDASRVYYSYQATLKAYQAVDFDDLILLPLRLLSTNEEVRARWQSRVRYLLVDEYQDTNACQYQLLRALTGPRAMFTAVGDDDQAIYGWRGATVENLGRLREDYPDLHLIKLEQNYRSSQTILAAANRVIEANPKLFDKRLWSEHGVGEPITVTRMDNEQLEAHSVAVRLSAARFEKQAKWQDFAILYRSNQQARVIEQALRDLRIPYTLSGGQSFFEKQEIRDLLAYLRLIANDDDDPAFIRAATTPRRGIGQASLHALGEYAGQHQISLMRAAQSPAMAELLQPRQIEAMDSFVKFVRHYQERADKPAHLEPVDKLLDDLLGAIGYENHLFDTAADERSAQGKWQNVLDLVDWLKGRSQEHDQGLAGLVQHVALVTMLDRQQDEEVDAVKLSTLHASKGLEFPHVYLIGVEEGLLPHLGREDDMTIQDDAQALASRIQEERRLMYVGITRAQRSLHLTWCARRRRARQERVCEVSRFVAEMGLGGVNQAPEDPAVGLSPAKRLDMLKNLLAGKRTPR